ncbi:hypothetical protein [Alteromonas lipolytica]|uniref:Uncharacterized protein n=1 Tax=Alteromonas lipolytica TaxID=1856405 RepID=A0A1E8FHN7_9ALTE|nr:hypothetical protein [Alteromonas lipolytica]OFI35450.1 hypothetical protein BFC17_11830 [Alteromonas lipolytica]GGF76361.1 hypothetical protein GCM10011338_30670 [Alteromonas lipolytica]
MHAQQPVSGYIKRETCIGLVINALFSLLFVWLIFGGQADVSLTGEQGLIIDSIPQGLAIGLLGSFFPSMLTRKRLAAGAIHPPANVRTPSALPQLPFLRALIFALISALVSLGLFTLLSVVSGLAAISFIQALVIKVFWGALLGGAVSNIALRFALRDYASKPQQAALA